MKIQYLPHYSEKFKKQFKKLPSSHQKKFLKQLKFLLQDYQHPSLHSRKMSLETYEARLDYHYRFTYEPSGKEIFLLAIGPHDEGLGKK